MVRIQSPNGDTASKMPGYKYMTSSQTAQGTKPTFDCYRDPKGPDIRLGQTGPEYKTTNYQHKEYKLMNPNTTGSNYLDGAQKSKPMYADKPVGMYKGDVTYKLNEGNNAAMRHWNYGFINDTVAATGTQRRPEAKYAVKERSRPQQDYRKPVESKPQRKAEVAGVAPIQYRQTSPRPPPQAAKSYKTSACQSIGPELKTTTTQTQVSKTKSLGTQYEPGKTKTMSVQTDSSSTPLPGLAPVPVPMSQSPSKVSTKSEGIQCSETPRTVAIKGTQSDAPRVRSSNTQTSPVIFETQKYTPSKEAIQTRHMASPEVAKTEPQKYTPSKEAIQTRHMASPEVAKTEPVQESVNTAPKSSPRDSPKMSTVKENGQKSVTFKSPSPTHAEQTPKTSKTFIPLSEPVPEVRSYPEYSKTSQSTYMAGSGSFPYQTSKHRLPPEITACIEAYDIAHGPK